MAKKASTSKSRARLIAAAKASPDLSRHRIMFDPEDESTYAPHSIAPPEVMRASARAPIPWPHGKEPTSAPLAHTPSPTAPLPPHDYLVVTWTVAEARSLADTLTPGNPSKTAWYPYAHNFKSEFVPLISKRAPAILDSHRLGSYFPTTIAGKRVLCFKSELHMSQDGPKLPIAKLWKQIIEESKAKLVITTGTAGGIGKGIELGDVVVAPSVRFDCLKSFKSAPFHNSIYATSKLATSSFAAAEKLFAANVSHLPPASRPPRIISSPHAGLGNADIVTTDFFAFDDTSNTFGLQGLGSAVEEGDAVLGLVVQQMGASAPKWAAVRNASDPEIDNAGMTIKEAGKKASQIYERFGYWTTIPSAIACWALIVDN